MNQSNPSAEALESHPDDPKGHLWVLHPACVGSHKDRPREIGQRVFCDLNPDG